MRVLKSILLLETLLLVCSITQAQVSEQPSDTNKKMPFEYGSYVQVMNMTMGEGEKAKLTQTVYFDRWGEWGASEIQSDTNIDTVKIHKLTIVKGNTTWEIDLITKTGEMYELTNEDMSFVNSLTSKYEGLLGEKVKTEELEEEEYLGYICKKTYLKYIPDESKSRKQKKRRAKDMPMIMEMEITSLSYGNLPMKMDMKFMLGTFGMEMSLKTISIDLNAPSASFFEVPDDVKIVVND